jgi:phosphoenolpyruvate synthase/pyruvate phosphate dikinase
MKNVGEASEKQGAVPESLKDLQWVVSELMFHRTNMIDAHNMVAFSYKKQMTELAQKHGLTYDEIIYCTWQEFIELIDNGVVPEGIKQRTKETGIIRIGDEYELLFGKKLAEEVDLHDEKVDENLREVKGMVGHPGKVKGVARVLLDSSDVGKVEDGEILIAAETTVDYEPGMAKAAGFVTNQGGITAHAAIIAREMKKPCVIGTRIATKVFKNGDVVEVDAEEGVVRKIE